MKRAAWLKKLFVMMITLAVTTQMTFANAVVYAKEDDCDVVLAYGYEDDDDEDMDEWEETDDDEIDDAEAEDDEDVDDVDDEDDEEDTEDEDDVDDEDDEADAEDEEDWDVVEEPELSSTSLKMKAGSVVGLKVSGDYDDVEWSSSNKNVAKVDSKGAIKALKAGSAKITAKVTVYVYNDADDAEEDDDADYFAEAEDDEEDFDEYDEDDSDTWDQVEEKVYKLTCTVKVTAPTIKLNKTKVTLKKGKTQKLKVSGTSAKVTWKTSNKKVATVSKGVVKAKKSGKATITAKVAGKTLKCNVVVKKK